MDESSFANLNPAQLREYTAGQKEKDYLLVDVRQPSEYQVKHIPGALLMPVSELQTRLYDLPSDRDLVFYCHSGGRSAFASDLVSEAEVTEKNVYNLLGGILAWDGKTLSDFPRVQVFEKDRNMSEMLMTAMNLEKGAFRFYLKISDRFAGESFTPVMEQLAGAEEAHAQSVYRYWQKTQSDPEAFESLFRHLRGDILEGGERMETVLQRLENPEGSPCLHVIELALHIEYCAYDLYRTIAEKEKDTDAKNIFLHIAQAEKRHMKMLVSAISSCDSSV